MIRSTVRLPSLRSTCIRSQENISHGNLVRLPWLSASMNRLIATSASSHADQASTGDTSFLENLTSLSRHASFNAPATGKRQSLTYKPPPKPHHLHIYAKRHNLHITLTAGNRDAILSVSSGILNFRKSQRGNYDAAFQLGAFVMAKIKNMGLLSETYPGKGGPIRALEVCFRDFGPGREAMRKILMGQEGALLRKKVTRVMDGTRLKFGGTRSKRRRRV